jgi:hypothetical protein
VLQWGCLETAAAAWMLDDADANNKDKYSAWH